jgi:hypothetical protein
MAITYGKHATKIGETSVGYMTVEIWFDPSFAEQGLAGYWDETKTRITIGPDSRYGAEQATILHELIHAVDDLFDLRLSERKVRMLEVCLTQGLGALKFDSAALKRIKDRQKPEAKETIIKRAR